MRSGHGRDLFDTDAVAADNRVRKITSGGEQRPFEAIGAGGKALDPADGQRHRTDAGHISGEGREGRTSDPQVVRLDRVRELCPG